MELVGVTSTPDPNAPVYKTEEKDGGKDMFLKLLVTQLQNQDPLDPMDNSAFVAQLAQFRQLEALSSVDASMTGMADSVKSMQNFNSANLLGRGVKVEGNGLYFKGNDLLFGYKLIEGAAGLNVSIYDSNQKLVRSIPLKGAGRGEYDYTWNGTDNNGQVVPNGKYTFAVKAYDTDGLSLEVVPHTVGAVSRVAFEENGVTITAGGTQIGMDKIKEIY